jgi:ferric-dicitrate binding protein FerR (iron transport regulator)
VEEAGRLQLRLAARSVDEAWDRFAAQHIPETTVVRPMWRRYVAIAAVAVALLGAGWFVMKPSEVPVAATSVIAHQTEPAENQTISLPDGSIATLNASSTLEWESHRELSLKGEAFFEVAKGSTFSVKTEHGTVQVLGTSFNVYARPDGFRVACNTGKVEVIPAMADSKAYTLVPGNIFSQKPQQKATVSQFSNKNPDSWRKGTFYFDNVPLNEVIAVMERQYNIQIQLNADSDRPYVGSFTNDNLEEAFLLVTKPFNLKVEKIGDKEYRFLQN